MKRTALLVGVLLCLSLCRIAFAAEAQAKEPPADQDKGKVTSSLDLLVDQLDLDLQNMGKSDATLAVMKLAENGEQARQKELGAAVQGELHTKLANKGYVLVERERLADILKEAEMAQLGLIDDEKAAEVAGLVGADILILGSVSEVGDRYLINVRAVSRENGTALSAQQVEVHSSHLIAIGSEAVVLKSSWGAAYRSMIAPGWGQLYNEEPIKAGVFISAEIASVAAVLALHFTGAAVQDDYENLTLEDFQKNPNKRQELQDKRNDLWLARDIMIGAAVGVWLINVLDAAISGPNYRRTEQGVEKVSAVDTNVAPGMLGTTEAPAVGLNVLLSY